MAAPPFWLETERLGLRRFTPLDIDWLAALYDDSEVVRYLGGRKDRAQVLELLNDRILRYYDEHPGLGIWMTVDRATNTPVGFHLLNHIQGESFIQVGFCPLAGGVGEGYRDGDGAGDSAIRLRDARVAANRRDRTSRQSRLAACPLEDRTPS